MQVCGLFLCPLAVLLYLVFSFSYAAFFQKQAAQRSLRTVASPV